MADRDEKKILIVDDERNNINVMVSILKGDYRIFIAKNGEEALKRAQPPNLPDLILLDIMMPGMDGYEVCRRLKADPLSRGIPVIFVTAMNEIEDEARGLSLGAIDYITKPVSPHIVRARVKNHLALKSALEEIENERARIEDLNRKLIETARFREDVERIARHDLKTPLNSIIGFSQMLIEEDNLNGEQKQCLSTIEESAYRILNILNMSVDLYKMEQGTYPFQPAPVNLLQTIEKIITDTRGIIRAKKIRMSVSVRGGTALERDSFYVRGEELLCYSMLANLIKNALEASPLEETVAIRLKETDDRAVIEIHNRGAVPEAIRDHFFDIYVTSGKEDGTGLGTYSARLIAETQKGNIRMETSETEGTTISIQLPL